MSVCCLFCKFKVFVSVLRFKCLFKWLQGNNIFVVVFVVVLVVVAFHMCINNIYPFFLLCVELLQYCLDIVNVIVIIVVVAAVVIAIFFMGGRA